MDGLFVVSGMIGAFGCLWYVWRHRIGRLARGVAAAGARYNELNGQGVPPQISPAPLTPVEAENVDPGPLDGS